MIQDKIDWMTSMSIQQRHMHHPAPWVLFSSSLFTTLLSLRNQKGHIIRRSNAKTTRRSPRSPFAFAIPKLQPTKCGFKKWTWLRNCESIHQGNQSDWVFWDLYIITPNFGNSFQQALATWSLFLIFSYCRMSSFKNRKSQAAVSLAAKSWGQKNDARI